MCHSNLSPFAEASALPACAYRRLVDRAYLGFVHLFDLAIVGEQPVMLALDIGDLGIDAAGHTNGGALVAQRGGVGDVALVERRSEERRVGKECRARWAADRCRERVETPGLRCGRVQEE